MKKTLRLMSLLLCCATFAACSGEDTDPAVADAGPALEPGAVTADGEGEETGAEVEEPALDDMFSDAGDSDNGTDPLMEGLEETPGEEPADAGGADDLFAGAASEEGAVDDAADGTAADDGGLNFGDPEPAAETADDSANSFLDDLNNDAAPAEETVADSAGAGELDDLTGDGLPAEPVAEESQSLDNLLTGDDPAATESDDGSDLLGELDATPADGAQVEAPEVAAAEFLDEMRTGNLATAARMIFSPADPQWQDMVKKQVDKLHEEMQAGVTTIEVLEPHRQGDWVLVVCKVTKNKNGQPMDRVSDQYFCLVDNSWKMMPETVRSDSAGQLLVNADFDELNAWYQENKPSLQQKYLQQ